MAFRIWSEDFKDGDKLPRAQVYNGSGHHGQNISPHLGWEGEPEGTKSFVVTCFDPDAPTGSGWWHWLVANIPASVHELPRGAGDGKGGLPPGAVQCRTDFGTSLYGGAAPPGGQTHRYIFTVHAIKSEKLDLDAHSSGAVVGFNVNFNTLGSASLTATYV